MRRVCPIDALPDDPNRPVEPSRPVNQRLQLGWLEWLSLPELGITRIQAKVDTGAKTSALHATDFRPIDGPDGPRLAFRIHLHRKSRERIIEASAPLVAYRSITSSNGQTMQRPVIWTTLELGGQRWPIELSLVSRPRMAYRMLLGREALGDRCVVLADARSLQPKPPKPSTS